MAEEKTKVPVIRLGNEKFDKINNYMHEEGEKTKAFMEKLMNLYELHNGTTKNISLIGDVEELGKRMDKIHAEFIGFINKLEDQKEGILEEKNTELQLLNLLNVHFNLN